MTVPNSIQDEEMSQWEKRVLVMLAYILLVGLLTLFCWHLESCLNKLRETFCPETCPTPFRLRHHGRMSGGYRRRRRRRRRRSSSSSSSSSSHEKIASTNGNPKEDTMTNVVTIIWRRKFYARCATALVILCPGGEVVNIRCFNLAVRVFWWKQRNFANTQVVRPSLAFVAVPKSRDSRARESAMHAVLKKAMIGS